MHLNGLNTQHGKSLSVAASQGTSRASSPGAEHGSNASTDAMRQDQSLKKGALSRNITELHHSGEATTGNQHQLKSIDSEDL